MKKVILNLSFILLTVAGFAQHSAKMTAVYDSGKIAYLQSDADTTKDLMLQVELKLKALDNFIKVNRTAQELDAVQKERESLEQLRTRLLIQSERIIQPLPPMQEIE
jgi:hypothetical protein